ncbi:MAG TPA: FAD-dependent monooxygenase, partial [Gemmatimonadaceae bacterium]|nr:FAD-dependent monooxygenase [Gemmatimonadaceae bacterium]
LALAAQLRSFDVPFRIVDRSLDRARESRAAAVQARTLELLQPYGLADALVARGNASANLELHFAPGRTARTRLADFGVTDTRFPFILFVSQSETEAVLGEHLAERGVTIERGVELVELVRDADGIDVVLRDLTGADECVRVRYVVGCDGAHSAVRKLAGLTFQGDAYLQNFMLGDVELDAAAGAERLAPDTVHSFPGRWGVAMIFPLGRPSTWRVIAMSTREPSSRMERAADAEKPIAHELSLAELQSAVDDATGGTLVVRDPVWMTHFRLHHRQASRYRAGRVFLAGDAAHIHSPVGGQGMNTGMQDAWNLGWKLALVVAGVANARLLDTYEEERWPVGQALLRYTDRAFDMFTRAMSSNALVAWVRRAVVSRVVPYVITREPLRRRAFDFVSELGIHYRASDAVTEGTPALERGPRAGERLPDAAVTLDGRATTLQRELLAPRVQLLLCGDADTWRAHDDVLARVASRYGSAIAVRRLDRSPAPGVLVDAAGDAHTRLGAEHGAVYLIRPDGHVAYRCAGTSLDGVERWLEKWLGEKSTDA